MPLRADAAMAGNPPGPQGRARALPVRAFVPIALLLLGYLVVVLFTFQDYGITFDEYVQGRYGDHIINWYRSGFADRDVLNYQNLEYYGGLFDVIAQAATRFSPFGVYETRHLFNALFGAIGVFAVWRIGVRLAGPRAGFLAALFLLFTPVWYGHSFANPKDIPFAAFYLLALDAMLGAVHHFPRIPWKQVLWLGVTIGLTLAVRFGGVLLFGYLGFAFLLWLLWRWRAAGEPPWLRSTWSAFVARIAVVVAVAWVVMLPWWPAAQVDPLRHPVRTLRALGNFDWNYPVLFEGREVLATDLPWTYLPKWALVTMPEFVLVGLVAAALVAVTALVRRQRGIDATGFVGWATLLFALLFPVVYAIATKAVLYDGLRHFLFAVPILAVVAATGFAKLLSLPRAVGWAAAAGLAFMLAWTAVDMVRLHPYQYIWFNHAVAGGLQKAGASYETDYWGAAYKEAAEWVAARYTSEQPGDTIRVATCSERTGTAYFLPSERFRMVGLKNEPELFLGDRRFHCIDRLEGQVVHTVERMGVPLVTIKELSGVAAGEAS